MKTVTIPTCSNPFVVIINGKKYTYPAGETVEVPDEVAEVIERHEEAHPEEKAAPGCIANIVSLDGDHSLPGDTEDGTIAFIPIDLGITYHEYLYNGVKLPRLIASNLPYYFITYKSTDGICQYEYVNTRSKVYYHGRSGMQNLYGYTDERPYGSKHYLENGQWKEYTGGLSGWAANTHIIWSNFDIYDEDGAIHLKATAPVEVVRSASVTTIDGKHFLDGPAFSDIDDAKVYALSKANKAREDSYKSLQEALDDISNRKYWKDNEEAYDYRSVIILGLALQDPGGTVEVTNNAVVAELPSMIAELRTRPVTVNVGIDGTNFATVRLVAQIVGEEAHCTFFFTYNNMLLSVTLSFFPTKLVYTVLKVNAVPYASAFN